MSKDPKPTPVVTVEEVKSETINNINTDILSDSRNLGLLAHLGGILFSFIPSLIIMLLKPEDKFVKEEATEALNFQLLLLMITLPCWFLSILILPFFVGIAAVITGLVFSIMGAVSNSNGNHYKYPINWRLIK